MKKIIIALFAMTAAFQAVAQDNIRINRRAELRNVVVSRSGDYVTVDFDVQANGRELRRKEGFVITPRVNDMELPKILVSGMRYARNYKREQALAGRRHRETAPGLMIRVRPNRSAVGHYKHVFAPAHEKGATLELNSYVETCCNITESVTRNMLAEPLCGNAISGSTQPIPDVGSMVTWLEPAEEVVKQRETSVTAHLNYPQGVTRASQDYGDNALEMARIDRILSPLMNRGVYNIRKVRIDGYASIEGRWDTNERLSRERAEDFRRWLTGKYGNPSNGKITVTARGEDWTGLKKMIREDVNMPYKQQALAIIDNYGIFDGREKQLMDLGQGVPYKYMYRWFFPKLRRMEVTFEYEVCALEGVSAEKVMESRPGDLSHAEMLRTLRKQKIGTLEMYRRIAAQYPDDALALINASSAEMVAGNTAEAWGYLQHVKDDPRAAGNLKAYRLLTSEKSKPENVYRYKIATE